MSELFSIIFSKSFIIQIIKYATVGACGTIFNISILFLCTEILNIFYIISEIIAFFISVIPNFLINKIWTFKESLDDKIVVKYFQYIIVSTFSLVINLTTLFILVNYFAIWYIFGEVLAIFVAFIISFLAHKLWTFRKRKNIVLNSDQI